MTDKEKLDKLVAEIKRLIADYNIKTEKYRGVNEQAHQYYGGKRDALSDILKSIAPIQEKCMYSKDNYTDEDRKALCDGCEEECKFNKKEEPASERFAFKAIPRLLEMIKPTDRAKSYVAKLVDALEKEGYVTDAKIVRESLMIMKGAKVAMATMDEEPVSEDLEKAIDTYLATYWGGEQEKQDWPYLKKMAVYFANWQKQQMEAYRIEHCKSLTNEQADLEDNFVSSHVEKNNRIPTFIDAIEYGIEYGKQQMMKEAVGATVHIDAGGYPYIPQMELYDYEKDIPLAKEGDKYKVILIKED